MDLCISGTKQTAECVNMCAFALHVGNKFISSSISISINISIIIVVVEGRGQFVSKTQSLALKGKSYNHERIFRDIFFKASIIKCKAQASEAKGCNNDVCKLGVYFYCMPVCPCSDSACKQNVCKKYLALLNHEYSLAFHFSHNTVVIKEGRALIHPRREY